MNYEGLMFPKNPKKKKQKKHGKSILQNQKQKYCFLCMVLQGDTREKLIHDHHIFFGRGKREISEEKGFKCNLCVEHHEYGAEAVHKNRFYDLLLKQITQEIYEQSHTREEFMAAVGKNYLESEELEMNKVILMGRLVRNPEVRYSQGENAMAIARYTIAVDKRFKREGEAAADFISCVAFGKQGEFAEKYLKKGTKIAITGRIQTGSYTNKDGQKVYTTDVVIEDHEFAESKKENNQGEPAPMPEDNDGFMNIPDGIEEELPFA